MQNLFRLLCLPMLGMAFFSLDTDCFAAESRGRAANNMSAGRSGMMAGARMPTMPTLPINSVGNMSEDMPDNNIVPQPEPKPDDPKPDPKPDEPKPDDPKPECPDGGVKNSEYTVGSCMDDIAKCINNGALPNGMNDLFNEDLRNSIVNGMGLCSVQVENCIETVRKNCVPVYRSSADVWIDFNARRVQPEYFNFVLRKTGLTPNQAENTCLLLDRNTYGSSFNAVATNGKTTTEYNNQVGAYNGANGNTLTKANPQGVTVNSGHSGVDGSRGHYARWDATTAECLIRVAAYNKDSEIKNSWLFGAVGDDRPAEVWKAAGETFTCNKDLFGFSLMKQTNTAAVVGIGGGTVLGAGVGALAGHGKRDFDCKREDHRKKVTEQLRESRNISILNEYLGVGRQISLNDGALTVSQCEDLMALYDKYEQIRTALTECSAGGEVTETTVLKTEIDCTIPSGKTVEYCFETIEIAKPCKGKGFKTVDECVKYLNDQGIGNKTTTTDAKGDVKASCTFRPLNLARQYGTGIYCTGQNYDCLGPVEMGSQISRLERVFNDLPILQGEKNNRLKTTLIGAGVGAGAGGVATAITALVEKGNINCRLGDGLGQVSFGKSHSIGSLKDFYVKWNLHLPDTILPTASVNTCQAWRAACGSFTDLRDCKAAQVNYKPDGVTQITLIHSACVPSGSVCIENYSVAKSYGACD